MWKDKRIRNLYLIRLAISLAMGMVIGRMLYILHVNMLDIELAIKEAFLSIPFAGCIYFFLKATEGIREFDEEARHRLSRRITELEKKSKDV